MNTSDLLEQLLRRGQAPGAGDASGAGNLGGLLGGLLRGGASGTSTGGLGGGLGGLGGLLGGLLGGGTAGSQSRAGGKYAALASLGMMAFQAYQAWQRQQPTAAQQAVSTIDTLEGPQAQVHSDAILLALIAASKADGRIDDQEQEKISAQIEKHGDDPELQQWLQAEVAKPLSAAEVARYATEPGIAAEMYLASVLVVDDQQAAERTYLDELAAALGLAPQLQAQLEQQAKGSVA
jgi:uncharacterized membrane protein YebE (DUF533 family)